MTDRFAAGPRPLVVALLFFASGASGLVYEVVWSRHLQDLFGVSTFAITTVVAAYMAGLALGSGLLGRLADRLGPVGCVAGYGLLEIVIGGFAFAFTPLLEGVASVYRAFAHWLAMSLAVRVLLDFLLAFGLLLVPTTLMGGTLPLVSRFFAATLGRTGRGFGRAYALNTLGAVLGVGLSGFVLLQHVGLQASLYLFGAINVCVGGTALLLAKGGRAELLGVLAERRDVRTPRAPGGSRAAAPAPFGEGGDRPGHVVVLALAAIGGCVSLGAEILWVRGFASLMLSTTYTFSLVLMVFLVGIALGSALGARLPPDRRTIVTLLTLMAGASLTQLVFYREIHGVLLREVGAGISYTGLLLLEAGIIAVVVFPMTVCSGALLPVLVGAYSRGTRRAGADVGTLYIANTIGSVTGVVLVGFVLLPTIGSLTGARVMAVVAGIGVLAAGALSTGALRVVGLAVVVVLALWWPSPSLHRQGSSPIMMAARSAQSGGGLDLDRALESEAPWRFETLVHGLTADAGVGTDVHYCATSLWINGMPNASTGYDQQTQLALAVLPYLYSKRIDDCLHIGLGSGITAGVWAALPGTRRTRIVELEGELWELSRSFEPYTLGLHERKSVEFLEDDARAYMELVPDRSLDVVSSEPSQLWVKGVGNLFTSEFFRLVKRKLREDGLFVTWMMGYNVPGEAWGIGVATLLDEFPHVFAFAPPDFPADVIFVCGKRPLELQRDRWNALAGLEGTAAYVLRRMGLLELHHLVRYALADRETLLRETRRTLARAGYAGVRNRTAYPVLEFLYPRFVHRPYIENRLLQRLLRARYDPARRRFLEPPGLEGVRQTGDVILHLALSSGVNPLPALVGVQGFEEIEPALPRLGRTQRLWAFVIATFAEQRELAGRLWDVIRHGPLVGDKVAAAALRLAEWRKDRRFQIALLESLPLPTDRTDLDVVRQQLRPLVAVVDEPRYARLYVDWFLAAFPPLRFMTDAIDYELLQPLVRAALACGRVGDVERLLTTVHESHRGRHAPVAVALADLLERRGRKREARRALARFLEHNYGGYLEEVRSRLRTGSPHR